MNRTPIPLRLDGIRSIFPIFQLTIGAALRRMGLRWRTPLIMNRSEADSSSESDPTTLPADPARCAYCGVLLDADAIGGVCPRCMFDAAMNSSEVAAKATEPSAPAIPGYQMVRELGRGGMGVVWLAFQTATEQQVAVKICLGVRVSFDGASPQFMRFQQEMRLAARFQCSQFARIFDGGECEGVPYFVMEYIEGQDLGDYVRERKLSHDQIIELTEKVCRAVQYAHSEKIIHRDLKPTNIRVTAAGEPKVLDFGVAKVLADDQAIDQVFTGTGHVVGTPKYMSPEQVRGQAVEPASDVFSLGVILYELITGKHPYGVGKSEELMHRIATEEPKRPREANERVNRAIELIILKALAREPKFRYETAGALADDLARWRRGERPLVGGSGAWLSVLSRRWLRTHRTLAWSGGIAIAAFGGFAVWHEWEELARHQRSAAQSVEVARMERDRKGRPEVAFMQLADALTKDPTSRVAATEAYTQLLRTRDQIAPWALEPPLQHADRVWLAAFSPDGRFIVTASADGTAQVWDSRTRKSVGPRLQHESAVVAAAFSPDGRFVATASNDGSARLWNVATGTLRGDPLRHRGRVTSIAFNVDGTRFATGSEDNTARLWDTSNGQPVGPSMVHADAVNTVAFSPDGRRMLSASSDKSARFWDSETGAQIGPLLPHNDPVSRACFSRDGRQVLTISDRRAQIWDPVSCKVSGLALEHDTTINAASFSPDGTRIATACTDGKVVIWHVGGGGDSEALGIALQHASAVIDARFSGDGCLIVTATEDGTARVWDAVSGEPLGLPLLHEGAIRSVEFSANALQILTASDDHTARLWDWSVGQSIENTFHHDGPVTRAVFSPDNRLLLTASWDGGVRVWNVENGQAALAPLRHSKRVMWAEFSPDGTRIVTASGSEATLWDARTGEAIEPRLLHDAQVTSVAFSPDGARIITSGEDGAARLWDTKTGEPASPPLVHPDSVRRACFSADGRWIVTACSDLTVRLWDARTLAIATEWKQDRGNLRSAVPNEKGTRIVLAGSIEGNPGALLWEPKSGRKIGLQHGSEVSSATFGPNSRLILTAGFDGVARLWDGLTGTPWGAPLCHASAVNAEDQAVDIASATSREAWDANFSSDGRWIVTAGADGDARLWEHRIPEGPAPTWVPRLLAMLASRELTREGHERSLTPVRRQSDREWLLGVRDDGGAWTRAMRWVLTDPRARTISPNGSPSVLEYIEREIDWIVAQRAADPSADDRRGLDRCASVARKAYRIDPAHPLVHLALGACEPADRVRAEFLYEYGISHLPSDEGVCLHAEKILRLLGESLRADQAAAKATAAKNRARAR